MIPRGLQPEPIDKMYSYYEWQKGTRTAIRMASRRGGERQYSNWMRENWVGTQDFTTSSRPTLLGDFKASFTRFATNTPDGTWPPRSIRPASADHALPDTTTLKDLPEINVNGTTRHYRQHAGSDVSNSIGFDTDFTKTWGSHNIHIGGMVYEFKYEQFRRLETAGGKLGFRSIYAV